MLQPVLRRSRIVHAPYVLLVRVSSTRPFVAQPVEVGFDRS